MGYDMYTEQKAPEEQAAVAAATEMFDVAVKARNALDLPFNHPEYAAAQADVDKAYEALRAAEKSYFRLNVWGMSRCCELMDRFGMLTGDEAPEFPRLEDHGLNEWPENPADYTDADRQYLAAVDSTLGFEPQPVSGIPVGKFSTNDGWLVTPAQCAAALNSYQAQPASDREDVEGDVEWWADWIAYLALAKDHGGFRVH